MSSAVLRRSSYPFSERVRFGAALAAVTYYLAQDRATSRHENVGNESYPSVLRPYPSFEDFSWTLPKILVVPRPWGFSNFERAHRIPILPQVLLEISSCLPFIESPGFFPLKRSPFFNCLMVDLEAGKNTRKLLVFHWKDSKVFYFFFFTIKQGRNQKKWRSRERKGSLVGGYSL